MLSYHLNIIFYFYCSLGILGIGIKNSKIIAKHYKDDIKLIMNSCTDELENINEIGYILIK